MILLILFLMALNFAISWFNAWACGMTWFETKSAGGFAHFMNWMGAIMSACGFTWCYLVALVLLGSLIPMGSDSYGNSISFVTPEMLQAVMDLGYLVIILPVLGSGLAITLNSWAVFYRRRTFGSGAVAGWNSFAQVHNMYQAASAIPGAASRLGEFFKGSKGGDNKGKGALLVILLVVMAVVGGTLTTRAIILSTARKHADNLAHKYAA